MNRHKSIGIKLMSWVIIASNVVFLLFNFCITFLKEIPFVIKLSNFVAIVAVFPFDFFHIYLPEFGVARIAWIIVMIFCAYGILKLDQFARIIFIVFNIIHGVVLTYIVLLHYGHHLFLDYFFKLYFNWVAILAYVGFLTIPEVREQFKLDPKSEQFKSWLKKTFFKQSAFQDPWVYFNLGLAYERLGRDAEAVKALKKALAIKADEEKFIFHLAMIYLKQKNYSEAVTSFKEVIRLNPVHVEAYYHLGRSFQEQGCDADAVKILEKISFLRPNHNGIFSALGKSYATLGRHQDALKAYDRVARLNAQDPQVYFEIGQVHCQLEQWANAKEVFRRVIKMQPEHLEANFHLGMVYVKLNRLKDAIRAFKEVLRLQADHKQAHYQLGFAYAAIGDVESAQRECRTLEAVDTDLAKNLTMVIKSRKPENDTGI